MGTPELMEVTARFSSDGKITPISFKHQSHLYQVDAVGRSWTDDKGHHILVLVPGERVFELVFAPQSGGWYLGGVGHPGVV